jgi:hypothetical protein
MIEVLRELKAGELARWGRPLGAPFMMTDYLESEGRSASARKKNTDSRQDPAAEYVEQVTITSLTAQNRANLPSLQRYA